jgi:ankyrin repeat protein
MKHKFWSLVVVGVSALSVWGAPVIPEAAIRKDDAAAVAQALRAGAEVNASYGNGLHVTALMKAADANAGAVAKVLIANKAEVNRTNKYGATALMQAAAKNATNVVALLLQHRAEVEASEQAGYNALMFAAEADAYEAVKLLVEHGAKINGPQNTYGMTPLIHAIKGRSLRVAELLVDKGADVNAAVVSANANAGNTPLMYAAGWKSPEIVKLLVKHGADLKARNKAGETALALAMKAELNDEVIAFLKEQGAP